MRDGGHLLLTTWFVFIPCALGIRTQLELETLADIDNVHNATQMSVSQTVHESSTPFFYDIAQTNSQIAALLHERSRQFEISQQHASKVRIMADKLPSTIRSGSTKPCLHDEFEGGRIGCHTTARACSCGWFEQCYPKFLEVVRVNATLGDIGMCGTALPILALMSVAIIIAILVCTIFLRLYFQHQETVAEARGQRKDPEDINNRRTLNR